MLTGSSAGWRVFLRQHRPSLDLACPVRIVAVSRGGDREGGNDLAFIITNWRCNALEAEFGFFVVVGNVVAAYLVEFFFEIDYAGQ